jgi:hypothetical protein
MNPDNIRLELLHERLFNQKQIVVKAGKEVL